MNQIRGQLAALAPADPTPVALPPPMDSPVKSLDPLQQSLSAAAVVDSSSSLDLRRSPSVVPPPPSEQQPTSAVQGIDLNLLAQLQGLSGGLSSLFAPAVPTALTTTTTSTAPSVVVAPIASANGAGGRGGTPAPVDPDEKATVTVLGPDPLIEEYNEALLSLDVHLTKKDLELCVSPCLPSVAAFSALTFSLSLARETTDGDLNPFPSSTIDCRYNANSAACDSSTV